MKFLQLLVLSTSFLLSLTFHHTLKGQDSEDNFLEMSLEDLMNVDITSLSKKSERQQDAASAIYVIDEQDINRSGATRLQDLLHMMVPGFFFQFNNYNDVDFGSRTFTDGFQGSVLMLIDNVPYQSPYTSAFDFGQFDFDLDEIERIEIIRGSGGTIYGANAATGVINIFTKQDQEGFRATYKNGNRGFMAPSIRYARSIDEKTNVKIFAKGNFFDGFKPLDELNGASVTVPVTDTNPMTGLGIGTSSGSTTIVNQLGEDVYRTNKVMGGININSHLSENTKLTAHSYFFLHKNKLYFPTPSTTAPIFLDDRNNSRIVSSIRLDTDFSENHSAFTQFSSNRETLNGTIGIRNTSTLNLEIQDNYTVGSNNISAGINLRSVNFRIGPLIPDVAIEFTKESTTEYLWGAFIQDKIKLGEIADITLGVKAETWTLIDNKPELSPSLRFSVRPIKNFTVWGAMSRSVTTPGYIQTNIELTLIKAIPNIIPLDVVLVNSQRINQSEYWTAELGIRKHSQNLAIDITGFYTLADDLIGITSPSTIPVSSEVNNTQLITPVAYANVQKSTNYGTETIIKYIPSSIFRLELSHTWFKTETEGKTDPFTGQKSELIPRSAPGMPEHVVRLRSYLSLGNDFEFSASGIYSTKAGSNNGFLYDQQRNENFSFGEQGISLDGVPNNLIRVDFKLEKFFSEKKSSVFIWGNDILNDGMIQNHNSFQTGIPMQVHRLFGAGATLSLN